MWPGLEMRGWSRQKIACTGQGSTECEEDQENHKVSLSSGWITPFQQFYLNSKEHKNLVTSSSLSYGLIALRQSQRKGRYLFSRWKRSTFKQIFSLCLLANDLPHRECQTNYRCANTNVWGWFSPLHAAILGQELKWCVHRRHFDIPYLSVSQVLKCTQIIQCKFWLSKCNGAWNSAFYQTPRWCWFCGSQTTSGGSKPQPFVKCVKANITRWEGLEVRRFEV